MPPVHWPVIFSNNYTKKNKSTEMRPGQGQAAAAAAARTKTRSESYGYLAKQRQHFWLSQLFVFLILILLELHLKDLTSRTRVSALVAPTIDYSHNMRVLKLPKSVRPGELIYRLKGSDGDSNSQLRFGVSGINGRALLDVLPTPGSWNEADVYLRSSLLPEQAQNGAQAEGATLPLSDHLQLAGGGGGAAGLESAFVGSQLYAALYNLTVWVADASNQTTQVDSTILVTNDDELEQDALEAGGEEARDEQRRYSITFTGGTLPLQNSTLRLPTLPTMGRVNWQRPLSPFLQPRHVFSVPESAQPGESIGQVSVRESSKSDLPVRFELRGRGSDHFAIKYVFGPRGQSRGQLLLNQPLDYERQNLFQLKVLALNAWTNTKYDTRNVATLDIVIAVGDVQDSAPQFRELPHSLRVANNMRPGELVARVRAEDGDYADQRPVAYALDASSPLASHFHINKQSGEITLKSAPGELALSWQQHLSGLQHQQQHGADQMLLSVIASELPDASSYDHLWPPMFARADLPVLLTDVVNEAPQFVGGSLAAADSSSAASQVAPTLRGFLREFANSPPASSGSTTQDHEVNLQGAPGGLSSGQLVHWYTSGEVPETSIGTSSSGESRSSLRQLLKAQRGRPMVVDLGLGLNGTFELSLEGPDAHLFELEPSYPVSKQTIFNLLVAPNANRSLFDFDASTGPAGGNGQQQDSPRSFHVELVARDFGSPHRMTARLRCLIDLLQVNDNAPQFDSDLYTFSVFENAQLGQVVGNVRARDPDRAPVGQPSGTGGGLLAGPQQRVRYTSLTGRDSHLFRLDPESGLITIEGQLDREKQDHFLLLAEARDSDGQAANYTKIVVNVLDVNDNAPVFTQAHYDAVLLPDGTFYQPLVVSATDADEPNSANSQVAYEIIAGNQNDQFTIDSLSGTIYPTGTGASQLPSRPIQLPSILSEPIVPYMNTRDHRGKIMPQAAAGASASHEIEETTAPTARGQPLRLNWPRSAAVAEDADSSRRLEDLHQVRSQTSIAATDRQKGASAVGMESLHSLLGHWPALDLLLNAEPAGPSDSATSAHSHQVRSAVPAAEPKSSSPPVPPSSGQVGEGKAPVAQLDTAQSQRGLSPAGQSGAFDASKVAPLTTLVVRAHDFGIPLRSATCKVNIYNQALLSRSVSLILNGTAEQLEQRREQLERAFGALTGSRAQIESIDALTDSSSISVARLRLSIPAAHSLIDLTDLSALMQALDYKVASGHATQQQQQQNLIEQFRNQQQQQQHYPVHYIATGDRIYPVHTSSNISSAAGNQGAAFFTDVQTFDSASSMLERKLLFYIIIMGVCILALLVIWMIYFCCKEDQQQRQVRALEATAIQQQQQKSMRCHHRSSDESIEQHQHKQHNKHKKHQHKSTSKTHLIEEDEEGGQLQVNSLARSASQLNLNQPPDGGSGSSKTHAKTTLGGDGSLHPIGSQLAKQRQQLSIPSQLSIKPDHYSMYNGQVWFEQGGLASTAAARGLNRPMGVNQQAMLHQQRCAAGRRASSAPSAGGGNSLDSGPPRAILSGDGGRAGSAMSPAGSGVAMAQPRSAAGQFFPNTLGYAENLATIAAPAYMYNTVSGGPQRAGGVFGGRRRSRGKVVPMTLLGADAAARLGGHTNEAFEQDLEAADGLVMIMAGGSRRNSHRHQNPAAGDRSKSKSHQKTQQASSTCSTSSDATQTLDEEEEEELDRDSVLLDSDQELLGFDSSGTPIIATHTRHKAGATSSILPEVPAEAEAISPAATVINMGRAEAPTAATTTTTKTTTMTMTRAKEQRTSASMKVDTNKRAEESDNKMAQQKRDDAQVGDSDSDSAKQEQEQKTKSVATSGREISPVKTSESVEVKVKAKEEEEESRAKLPVPPKGKSQDLMSELNERLSSANKQRALTRQSADERDEKSSDDKKTKSDHGKTGPHAGGHTREEEEEEEEATKESGIQAKRKIEFAPAASQRRASETMSWQSELTMSESGSAGTAQEPDNTNRLGDMKNGELLEKQSIFALTYSGLATDKLPS